ncbi:hypothetical protein THRCLA_20800 [Thraustotheca clavata]|uniref:Uncharacterized protein n=1 Tax=Thraustotheca clavata TaxID=74557 RepID=A0A1W0A3L2_9STRA|nr:hypothetical protein THRCLA_20800 [Thraustotheca clavata]
MHSSEGGATQPGTVQHGYTNCSTTRLKAYISKQFPCQPTEHIEFLDTYQLLQKQKQKRELGSSLSTWGYLGTITHTSPELPPPNEDPSKFLLTLPYLIYFDKFQHQQTYQLIVNYAATWIESRDTIYVATVRQTTANTWLIFKWIYRCGLSIYIMATMWQKYIDIISNSQKI